MRVQEIHGEMERLDEETEIEGDRPAEEREETRGRGGQKRDKEGRNMGK